MQLSRPLWLVLAVAGALILLASNAINSSSSSKVSSQEARLTYSKHRDFRAGDDLDTALVPSTLLAFVGVMTAAKPERRQVVRSTWFPSSEADLARYAKQLGQVPTGVASLSDTACGLAQLRKRYRRQAALCCGSFPGASRSGCFGRGAAEI